MALFASRWEKQYFYIIQHFCHTHTPYAHAHAMYTHTHTHTHTPYAHAQARTLYAHACIHPHTSTHYIPTHAACAKAANDTHALKRARPLPPPPPPPPPPVLINGLNNCRYNDIIIINKTSFLILCRVYHVVFGDSSNHFRLRSNRQLECTVRIRSTETNNFGSR